MALLSAVGGGLVLGLLVYLPGRVVTRGLGRDRDLFAAIWLGFAITSVAGLVLAQAGHFSLPAVTGAVAGVCGVTIVMRWPRPGPSGVAGLPDPADHRGVRRLACVAALGACLWCWPPFETVIAGADSTMYVNAGVHLARAGSLVVHDTAVGILGERTARHIFPSVRMLGGGPFIRLPGGLLMWTVTTDESVPAFFPLVPVWTGLLSAVWGPEGAPVAAPVFAGLATWALVLLAGETFGLAAASAAAGLLLANFAVWWFGRFLMPELLAAAFLWGALVFLRRGAYASAGVMLGVAGLARAELVPFVVGAVTLWATWVRIDRRLLLRLVGGFVPLLALIVYDFTLLPSHHLAYLRNDVGLALLRALYDRSLVLTPKPAAMAAMAGILVLLAVTGVVAVRRGLLGRNAAPALTALGLAAAVSAYVWIGGSTQTLPSIGWLAAYCSWPVLAFAMVGGIVVWGRGDAVTRLAAILWVLVATVFILNPRVSVYQPWAIRRFLPVVIPGLVFAASVAVARIGGARRRATLVLVTCTLAALEIGPVLAVRHKPFFAGSFASIASIAQALPADALVLVDSEFADVQVQVPLWLVYGRETVVLAGGTSNWREALYASTAAGRQTYWMTNRFLPMPKARGLIFAPTESDPELELLLPDAPSATPPGRIVIRRVPMRLYRVERATAREPRRASGPLGREGAGEAVS